MALDALREVEVGLTAHGHDLERLAGIKAIPHSAQRTSNDARRCTPSDEAAFFPYSKQTAVCLTSLIGRSLENADGRYQIQFFLAPGGDW